MSEPCDPSEEFDEIVCIIVEKLESGTTVDPELIRHEWPQYADRLAELLPALEAMATIKAGDEPPAKAWGANQLPATGVLGDFRILREIGRGGMGVVYEAEQISLGRHVALKVLPFAGMLGETQLRRFQNEARAAATLHHEHIVPVYFVGNDRGVHFYAMQLISGQSLEQLIRAEQAAIKHDGPSAEPKGSSANRTTVARANSSTAVRRDARDRWISIARLGIEAAQALHYAHELGVVHRDIKPGNLMLDERGKLWITDFGLARFEADAGLTMTGDVMGTLRYMSPEQAQGSRVADPRGDIYSLGVTLFELITLEPAYARDDRQQLLTDITSTDLRSARKANPLVPADLSTIIQTATACEATDRYASASEMAADLRRFAEGHPIKAKPPGFVGVARKWARRHREVVNVAVLCGVILLVVGAAFVADRRRQLSEATLFVENSLAAARQAFAEEDIEGCERRLAEAKTRFKGDKVQDNELQRQLESLTNETERYRQFAEFLTKLRFDRAGGNPATLDGLALYGVLENDDWLARLESKQLPSAVETRIKEGVFQLLLAVADSHTRWIEGGHRDTNLAKVATAVRCLEKAAQVHANSRGYYWLLANCALLQRDYEREAELRALAMQASLHHAAELFYVNRDNLWGSNSVHRGRTHYSLERSYRDHRDMLRFDPAYQNALFFLALRLGGDSADDESLAAWCGYVAANPTDAQAVTNRAGVHLRLGQYAEARLDYERALELRPDFPGALPELAWILATAPDDHVRDGRRAVELAKRVLSLEETPALSTMDILAAAYAEDGDFAKAIDWQLKAIEKADVADAREYQALLELYRQGQPYRSPRGRRGLVGELSTFAARLAESGDIETASILCNQAIDKSPPPSSPWWEHTGPYSVAARHDELFTKVREHRPDDRILLMVRVNILGSQGRFKEATELFPLIIALDRNDYTTYFYAAPLFLTVGDQAGYKNCCDELARCIQLSDAFDQCERTLKTLLLAPGLHSHEPLAHQLAERIRQTPRLHSDPWMQLVLAISDSRQGKYDSAIEHARLAREPVPASVMVDAHSFVCEAIALHKQGNHDLARKQLEAAAAAAYGRLPHETPDRAETSWWADWLRYQLYFAEAKSLIDPGPADAPAKSVAP